MTVCAQLDLVGGHSDWRMCEKRNRPRHRERSLKDGELISQIAGFCYENADQPFKLPLVVWSCSPFECKVYNWAILISQTYIV